MAVSDPDTGKVVATPAIGAGSDGVGIRSGHRIRVQLERRRHADRRQQTGGKWDVLENIATERGARTIALDDKTHKLYLPTAKTAPAQGNARPTFLPDTFKVLVVGK